MSAHSMLSWLVVDAVSLFPERSARTALRKSGVAELLCSANGFSCRPLHLAGALDESSVNTPAMSLEEVLESTPKGVPLLVTCDDTSCFSHELLIPTAAQRHATAILLQEMEHCTPFKTSEVYHFQWAAENRPHKGCLFQQAILKRSWVDQLLSDLNAHKHPAIAFGFRRPDGTLAPAFMQPDGRPFGSATERWWSRAAAASVAVFLFVAIWSGWSAKESLSKALALWQKQVDALEQEATAKRIAQETADRAEAVVVQLIDRRSSEIRTSQLMAELTRLLPDSAWLQMFEIKGNAGSIEGEALHPEEVLQSLEESQAFGEVSFASPVYGNSQTGRQHFSISFHIESR